MTAKYDGVVFQVEDDDDTYHIFDTEDDSYNLVHDKTKKIYEGYCESTIDYHFSKGNWVVLKEEVTKPDAVNSPKHYSVFEEVEAIQVIASSMTQDQFYGYCFGNILKYRLRAGGKDDVMQELSKADKYQELYSIHKHLCKEESL